MTRRGSASCKLWLVYISLCNCTHVGKRSVRWSSDEHDQWRELGRPQYFQRLRLHVQYGDFALVVDLPYRVQLRAVHGIVVGAYLTVHVIHS